MAPQKPRSDPKHRSRPSSGAPSPIKSSSRKPGEKREPGSPEKKRPSRDPEKRRSVDPEKRRSQQEENRKSNVSEQEDWEKRHSPRSSPRKGRGSPTKTYNKGRHRITVEYEDSQVSSNTLSIDSLAKFNALSEKAVEKERKEREKKERERGKIVTGRVMKERIRHNKHRRRDYDEDGFEKKKTRIVSVGTLEKGKGHRGGFLPTEKKKRKRLFLLIGFLVLLLIILIPVGVLVVGKQNNGGDSSSDGGGDPSNSNLNGISENDIPTYAKGSILDPFTWYDTTDFNVTFTNDTIGGLSLMGLNSSWDDSVRANKYVPAIKDKFNYGKMPIRGVNVGGWLSLEPFISPSLFNSYDTKLGIIDEYTLCAHLGKSQAASTLEKHYATFINAKSFADIRDAGFDHVRIPFSYWAVTTYSGDPYVAQISWRYLLRGIEYARQNGLRVNLDLHGIPGSQNGWNHSGRQGPIAWLNGTDGDINGQRSLDIHTQLSTFFAQPRYKNVVGIYGLVNEPKMISLPTNVVLDWTTKAINIVQKSGMTQLIAFGDGFLGLPNWQGKLQGMQNLVIDAHQYVIFNTDQIAFDHKAKLNFACAGWKGQMAQSMNTATG